MKYMKLMSQQSRWNAMAISKEAKALLTAQEASLNVASKELKNILKESKK